MPVAPFLLVAAPAIAIYLLTRYDARLTDPYWTVSDVLMGWSSLDISRVTLASIVRRFSWVLVASLATNLLFSGPQSRGAWIGACAAFLLIWPAIATAETLPLPLYERRKALYVIYILTAALYALIGLAGASIGNATRDLIIPALSNSGIKIDINSVANNLVSSLIWVGLAGIALFVRRYVSNKIRRQP
ncbi:hypothetical protein GS676_11080 [Rhodococcus hoagii]|nr:hypothetical protein [Prescottella equi]